MAPTNWTWSFFIRGKKKYRKNKSNFEAYCQGCVTHYMGNLEKADQQAVAEGASVGTLRDKGEIYKAGKLAKPMCGRPTTFRVHIRNCPHVALEAKERLEEEERNHAGQAAEANSPGLDPGVPPVPQSLSTLPPVPQLGLANRPPIILSPTQLHKFHIDILHLFVANNFALHAIDSPQTHEFFDEYLPGVELPTRQALGGRLLKEAVQTSQAHTIQAVNGKMATGISDGWKDKQKRSVLAYMINVESKAHTVGVKNVSALPKTAQTHLDIVKEAIKHCEEKLGVKIIGWVSDAGGESRAMRVRLGKDLPELLLFDCWPHQVQLVVGNLLKLKIDLVAACDSAHEIAKWFRSHSQALALLQGEQVKAGGRSHVYPVPNLTRWTSHYLTAQGLLDDRGPLRATVALHRTRLEQIGSRDSACTERILGTVEQPEFWDKLDEITSYLRPLAIALNVAQAPYTRLDHILITLGRLYQIFNDPRIRPEVRACLLASLELRWRKADQDPFLLAVLFNPYIRQRLFSPDNPDFCANGLYTIVRRVFERVFQKAPDSGLFEAFIDYYHWSGEFSAEAWHLKEYSELYKHEGKEINLVALWSTLPCPGTVNTGRHQLACLAKLVLSIIANSAGAERLFSRMGNIHTNRRNRMHFDRVHDLATVGMDLQAQHQAAGRIRKRKKRHFDAPRPAPALRTAGEPETDGSDSLPDPPAELLSGNCDAESSSEDEDSGDESEPGGRNLTALAAQLNKALDDDNDDEIEGADNEELPEPAALATGHQSSTRPRRLRLYFSKAHAIPLSEIFDYSDSDKGVEGGLGVFWNGGIHNLGLERGVYEALAAEQE